MRGKPDSRYIGEIKRLLLEKLVMRGSWGHKHVEQRNLPAGLPRLPNNEWYHYVKHQLKRERWLVTYKEHGKDLYALNIKRKREIEQLVGTKVTGPLPFQ